MAAAIGADSLRYFADGVDCPLPRQAGRPPVPGLHQRRIYPTPAGERLYQIALQNAQSDQGPPAGRTYDAPVPVPVGTAAAPPAAMTNA